MKPAYTGMTRIWKATFNSLRGIKTARRYEAAFRQEALMCAALIPVALLVEASVAERLLLIMSLFVLVITELLNSAEEAVVDRCIRRHRGYVVQTFDILDHLCLHQDVIPVESKVGTKIIFKNRNCMAFTVAMNDNNIPPCRP